VATPRWARKAPAQRQQRGGEADRAGRQSVRTQRDRGVIEHRGVAQRLEPEAVGEIAPRRPFEPRHRQHRKHADHGGAIDREDRVISIIEAVLLAVVAVLAAWSGYSAAKWGTAGMRSLVLALLIGSLLWFTVGPLAIWVSIRTRSMAPFVAFWVFQVVWAYYHVVRQHYGFMALYQKHGVNPLGGCMPMALQMPFLFAFYKVFSIAIEMRGASWLWVTDLSQHETIPIHILPILMIATQFIMQKMTPTTTGGDPAQQKIMMFMPLMFGFMFYSASSGLVLYWLTGNVVNIAQQWFFNRTGVAADVAQSVQVTKKKNGRK
jgi:YidC/Oxa1 family membrane protein insertase